MAKVYEFPARQRSWHEDIAFWLGLYIVMLITTFYFGLNYYPIALDNTYGIYYRRSLDIWNDIILFFNSFGSSPLAFLTDAYIVMRFWNNLWAVVLALMTLHFFSCFFLSRIFVLNGFKFGVAGISIFALSPPVFFAVYWLHMSIRISSGMFFAIFSVYWFSVFHNRLSRRDWRAGRCLTGFWFFNLLSMGYGEYIAVFSFVFALSFVILNFKKLPVFSRIYSVAIPVINAVAFCCYIFFISGLLNQSGNYIGLDFSYFKQWISLQGFFRGIELAGSVDGLYLTIIAACFAGFTLYRLLSKKMDEKEDKRANVVKKTYIGISMTLIPICFFLNSPNLALIVPIFAGLSVIIDAFFDRLGQFEFSIKNIKGDLLPIKNIVAPAFIALSFIINISIVEAFKITYETDTKIAENFLLAFENSSFERIDSERQSGKIFIFNVKQQDYFDVVYSYVIPSTSSDMLFMQKVNAISNKYQFSDISLINDQNDFIENFSTEIPIFEIDENFNVSERVN